MKNLLKKYKEIISYIIFGLLTTVVSWGSYTVFANVCGLSVFVSNLLSWICAVVFAFITNKLWVFESKSWKPAVIVKESISFVSSRAITGVLEVAGVPLLAKLGFDSFFYGIVEKMGITIGLFFTEGIYSKLAFSVIVVIVNYVFSKLFIFKNKTNDKV